MKRSLGWSGVLGVLVLAACGGEAAERSTAEGDRVALIEACETQQGIEWLRREYGEDYCDCRADVAKEALDVPTYRMLVEGARAELEAGSPEEREGIARDAFEAYAQAADAARMNCRG